MVPKLTFILSSLSNKPLHKLIVEVAAAVIAAPSVTHSFNESKKIPRYMIGMAALTSSTYNNPKS